MISGNTRCLHRHFSRVGDSAGISGNFARHFNSIPHENTTLLSLVKSNLLACTVQDHYIDSKAVTNVFTCRFPGQGGSGQGGAPAGGGSGGGNFAEDGDDDLYS